MSPSPLSGMVDEQHLGSAGGQLTMGIAGIVLAVVLVVGQISLATTKGMAVHLSTSVDNLTQGNQIMESVVERAAATTVLETALEQQSATLANTRDAMAQTNAELDSIIVAKRGLLDVVGGMQTTGDQLASSVGGLSGSTSSMTGMLGTLPDSTERTHKQLSTINGDTAAINTELAAIGRKMRSYGLPRAKGAPTG
jgi:hypothetical protein